VPEVSLDFSRQWIEFVDPDNEDQIFRCDLTWLTSMWTCIYGSGCKGLIKSQSHDGCCILGAHFADKDDEKRVKKFAAKLTDEQWQYRKTGRKSGLTEKDAEGERKTRVVDDACIFLNREGFPSGEGCALHKYALDKGVEPLTTKPEVCWQVPIRRTYEWTDRPDDSRVLHITIGEYDRRGWGPGGHDFDWYCTGDPIAHVGAEPVYLSNSAELEELMGKKAYVELVAHCDARVAAMADARKRAARRREPVDLALLPFAPHPADPL